MVLSRFGSTSSQDAYWRYHEAFSASSVPCFFFSHSRKRATVWGQKQNSGFWM